MMGLTIVVVVLLLVVVLLSVVVAVQTAEVVATFNVLSVNRVSLLSLATKGCQSMYRYFSILCVCEVADNVHLHRRK